MLEKLIFNSEVSLFFFCPNDLSYGEGGLLESSTMIVTPLVCVFNSLSMLLIKWGTSEFGVYMSSIVIVSWLLDPLIRTNFLSLSHD